MHNNNNGYSLDSFSNNDSFINNDAAVQRFGQISLFCTFSSNYLNTDICIGGQTAQPHTSPREIENSSNPFIGANAAVQHILQGHLFIALTLLNQVVDIAICEYTIQNYSTPQPIENNNHTFININDALQLFNNNTLFLTLTFGSHIEDTSTSSYIIEASPSTAIFLREVVSYLKQLHSTINHSPRQRRNRLNRLPAFSIANSFAIGEFRSIP